MKTSKSLENHHEDIHHHGEEEQIIDQENHEDIQIEEIEDIPDEFQCCVCLELLYKPVVLGCGHIACFWCIFKAMNTWRESYCPICRHPYHHFPSVCRLMHFLLVKLYPLASERREKQVAEEEKEEGHCAPQFDDYLLEKESCGKTDLVLDTASPHSTRSLKCGSEGEGEPSSVDGSLGTVVPATSTSQTNMDAIPKTVKTGDDASRKQALMSDFLCRICKQLLCRPVVLNCGHVYCESCVISPNDKLCRCPVCQMEHPNGCPNVCLVLEHFMEEQFPESYAERKRASVGKSNCQIPSTCLAKSRDQEEASRCSTLPKFDISAWLSGEGPKVHFGVGCDYCGMCPIVGDRYKCTDCKEKIGFDLCEGCYKSSSKLPGRFNQQHTPDHKFELIQPLQVRNVVLRLQRDRPEEDNSIDFLEDIEDNSFEIQYLEEDSSETNSLIDEPSDGQAGHISSNDTGEDQGESESANRN